MEAVAVDQRLVDVLVGRRIQRHNHRAPGVEVGDDRVFQRGERTAGFDRNIPDCALIAEDLAQLYKREHARGESAPGSKPRMQRRRAVEGKLADGRAGGLVHTARRHRRHCVVVVLAAVGERHLGAVVDLAARGRRLDGRRVAPVPAQLRHRRRAAAARIVVGGSVVEAGVAGVGIAGVSLLTPVGGNEHVDANVVDRRQSKRLQLLRRPDGRQRQRHDGGHQNLLHCFLPSF